MRFGIGISRPESRDNNVVASYVLSDFQRSNLMDVNIDIFRWNWYIRELSFQVNLSKNTFKLIGSR